jgi:hypothetical protein
MIRRLMSASGKRIARSFEDSHRGRSLRICKSGQVATSDRPGHSRAQALNVANLQTLGRNWDPGVTIGIGTLTISQPLWSTRRDWQDASCAEPYRNRGPETVRQVMASALPMRLGGESGP